MGDSLTRQFYEALVQLLRGDLATGALRADTASDMRRWHPNSLVYVGGAPPHPQREAWGDAEVKMNAPHAIRHLVGPMRNLTNQCGVPAKNLVWAPMHWSDLSKIQKVWQLNQTPADILRYNAATSAAARALNLTVFDTYNDTAR
ncbi:hypothetical protein WJX81_002870 [Elliptochloris bilobata]|uniref:Uncharacterized protein n=1 Tax=Elliptochloris bilobata TaxID=381761 RepID=A0AAW1RLF8_9CHLO